MKWIKANWKKFNRSRKPRIVFALLATAVIAFTGFYFAGEQASAAEYMTARVERGNLRNTVTATGTLQAVTTVQVGSQASGTISALYADFNSTVKKGQVIAQLDPPPLIDTIALRAFHLATNPSPEFGAHWAGFEARDKLDQGDEKLRIRAEMMARTLAAAVDG